MSRNRNAIHYASSLRDECSKSRDSAENAHSSDRSRHFYVYSAAASLFLLIPLLINSVVSLHIYSTSERETFAPIDAKVFPKSKTCYPRDALSG